MTKTKLINEINEAIEVMILKGARGTKEFKIISHIHKELTKDLYGKKVYSNI